MPEENKILQNKLQPDRGIILTFLKQIITVKTYEQNIELQKNLGPGIWVVETDASTVGDLYAQLQRFIEASRSPRYMTLQDWLEIARVNEGIDHCINLITTLRVGVINRQIFHDASSGLFTITCTFPYFLTRKI